MHGIYRRVRVPGSPGCTPGLFSVKFWLGGSGVQLAEASLDALRGPATRLHRTLDRWRRDVIAADEELVGPLHCSCMAADTRERARDAVHVESCAAAYDAPVPARKLRSNVHVQAFIRRRGDAHRGDGHQRGRIGDPDATRQAGRGGLMMR
ncbi:MAG: hypothetical protein ACI80N_003955 [Gammaproteobacteria bacterium]|jgi:hypothetical protein